jgi:hypothetical protein
MSDFHLPRRPTAAQATPTVTLHGHDHQRKPDFICLAQISSIETRRIDRYEPPPILQTSTCTQVQEGKCPARTLISEINCILAFYVSRVSIDHLRQQAFRHLWGNGGEIRVTSKRDRPKEPGKFETGFMLFGTNTLLQTKTNTSDERQSKVILYSRIISSAGR